MDGLTTYFEKPKPAPSLADAPPPSRGRGRGAGAGGGQGGGGKDDPAAFRMSLGIPTNARIYLCPQTLMKFNPDFGECDVTGWELLGG